MTMLHWIRSLLVVTVCLCASSAASQTPPTLQVLKIAAGPAGVESNGVFTLTEERARFSRSADKEVVVHFQWEGTAGTKKLEAIWRSPDGASSSKSVVEYVARTRRFGAYWRFALSPDMQLGTWAVEATVDGEPAGRFTFEIIDPEAPRGVTVKRPLAQPELYERLARSYVVLQRDPGEGRVADAAGGVILRDGTVLTSLHALDGVAAVKAILPGRPGHLIESIKGASRTGGWAIVAAPAPAASAPVLAAEAPRVGDRCFSMQSSESGGLVLLEGQITGVSPSGGWIAAFVNGAGTVGAPVVNELGELLGVLGRTPTFDMRALRAGGTIEFGHIAIVPATAVPAREGAPMTMAEMRARGLVLEPLVNDVHVLSGGFAAQIGREQTVSLQDQRQEFSSADKDFVVFVTWAPRVRLRGQGMIQVRDVNNAVVAESKPRKLDLRAKELTLFSARLPVFATPGTYRAEVLLDGKPAWRGYVRIIR
jgi:hypothetical protein